MSAVVEPLDIPPGFSDPEGLGTPVCVRQAVAWGEMDSLGHVNNIIYLRWLENARFEWFERVGVSAWMRESGGAVGPILARVECDYRLPVGFPDKVWTSLRCVELGGSSMRLRSQVWSEAHGAVAAEGDAVIVLVDYAAESSVRVPEPIRAAIRALDGEGLVERGRSTPTA
ncbi:predicted thioesterase [Plesiocystis pacifica SIR-1]|uniref:Predicted thioesterase n=1 Tax=Plesiocystis pacifica SIR-1 TaxID=391625 RepID=A6FWV2_9BACT|nr:predicted thioesterase [Plesiocystis pacifica SIR-1]